MNKNTSFEWHLHRQNYIVEQKRKERKSWKLTVIQPTVDREVGVGEIKEKNSGTFGY